MSKGRADPKPLQQIRNAVFGGFNVLLSAFQSGSGTPVVEMDFSKEDASSTLYGLQINKGV